MEREKKKYPNCGRKREIENVGQSSSQKAEYNKGNDLNVNAFHGEYN